MHYNRDVYISGQMLLARLRLGHSCSAEDTGYDIVIDGEHMRDDASDPVIWPRYQVMPDLRLETKDHRVLEQDLEVRIL